ncbi:hypothetical protein ACJBU6_07250 [Exserohilum turcicum]
MLTRRYLVGDALEARQCCMPTLLAGKSVSGTYTMAVVAAVAATYNAVTDTYDGYMVAYRDIPTVGPAEIAAQIAAHSLPRISRTSTWHPIAVSMLAQAGNTK